MSCQLESLLKRIERQALTTTERRPPDQASAALGRHLAASLEELLEKEDFTHNPTNKALDDKILPPLCLKHTNPAIPHSFFSALRLRPLWLEWTPRWILRLQELCLANGNNEALLGSIRFYARLGAHHHLHQNHDATRPAQVMTQLHTRRAQTSLQREFIQQAFHSPTVETAVPYLLSPLLAVSVLKKSNSTDSMFFLECLWCEGWKYLRKPSPSIIDAKLRLVEWMTQSLHLFVQTSASLQNKEEQSTSREIAHCWLQELSGMMLLVSEMTLPEASRDALGKLVLFLVEFTFPFYFAASGYISMEPILSQLHQVVQDQQLTASGNVCWILASEAMSTPITEDMSALLVLLVELADLKDTLVRGLLYSVACWAQDPTAPQTLSKLASFRQVDVNKPPTLSRRHDDESSDHRPTSVLELLRSEQNMDGLLETMAISLKHMSASEMSPQHQNSALLIGTALLYLTSGQKQVVWDYLRTLLQRYPHLGITLLPILLNNIQLANSHHDVDALLRNLTFICELVVDPQCAQTVWDLLGRTMTLPHNAVSVRTYAIRLFPTLCARNKRLYRRIIEALGTLVEDLNVQVRLAVAATIHDLAKEDLIRDISDVIGWIQAYLNDEDEAVVHFAVSSLHFLVVAQELDFDLVIKVLNKRLCPIFDIGELLDLPLVVLEALVLLLGDGEGGDDGSDDEEKSDARLIEGVSPQISGAVATLIGLAQSEKLAAEIGDEQTSRIRLNIFKSLANYSLSSLGVEESGVRESTANLKDAEPRQRSDSASRYESLRLLILDGVRSPPDSNISPKDNPVISLAQKLVAFEEETLGVSLWQKKQVAHKGNKGKSSLSRVSKSVLTSLPDANTIKRYYQEDPGSASSIAVLLSIDGETSLASLFELASDVSPETRDPFVLVFLVQGWLNAMGKIWSGIVVSRENSLVDSIQSALDELRGWCDLLDNMDIPLLAMASFSLYVSDTFLGAKGGPSETNLSYVVESIQNEIETAFSGHRFSNRDIASLCIALVGLRAVHGRNQTVANRILKTLVEVFDEHGNESCFGASYGLSLFAQVAAAEHSSSLTQTLNSDSMATELSWISTSLSVLVDELKTCIPEGPGALTTLAVCLRGGKSMPDLERYLSTMSEDKLRVSDTMKPKALSLFLSLSICLPSLSVLDTDLVKAVYALLQKFPYGSGKEYALPSACRACLSAGWIDNSDLESVYEECQRESESMDSGIEGALFCLTVLQTLQADSTNSYPINKQVHHVKNHDPSLLAAVASITTIPALGVGAPLFCSTGSILPPTTKENTNAVVALLEQHAGSCDSSGNHAIALLLLGYLSGARGGSKKLEPVSTTVLLQRNPSSKADLEIAVQPAKLSFSMLPYPQEGTVLSIIFDHMQIIQRESVTAIAIPLHALFRLSLPSQFASGFIEPLLVGDSSILKVSVVELLTSQVSGRRRATFDGRDFIKIVTKMSLMNIPSLLETVGRGASHQCFVAILQHLLPKVPSDAVHDILQNLWKSCCAVLLDTSEATSIVAYLQATQQLLVSASNTVGNRRLLSPRSMHVIFQVLLGTILDSLTEHGLLWRPYPRQKHIGSDIIEAYLGCIMMIPFHVLDDEHFFRTDKMTSDTQKTGRMYIAALLVIKKYFNQPDRLSSEVMRIVSWVLRQDPSSDEMELSRGTFSALTVAAAIAAKGESFSGKRDLATVVLDAMHVHGPSKMRLLLFARLACLWSPIQENDGTISMATPLFRGLRDSVVGFGLEISDLATNDMPANIVAVGLSELVSNRLQRVIKDWSLDQSARSQLHETLLRCHARDIVEMDFVSLVSTILTQSR